MRYLSIGVASAAFHGRGALEHQVRALGQPDGRGRVRVLHPAQVVDPRAGGVEHEAGVDAELGAVHAVLAARRRVTRPPGEAQAGDLGVVEDDGAGVDGRADGHQRHPGVVHLVVAVDGDGLQVLRPQLGHVARRPWPG